MPLPDNGLLARHALEKSHYRADGTVKPNAFRPAPNGETSVFHITDLGHEAIEAIGNKYVAAPQGRKLKGWSEITVKSVVDCGLILDPDNNPERHVTITGWPEERSEQLAIQMDLSKKARFIKI